MAAQSRGSVNVFVQPLKLSLLAIATAFCSSRSVRTWKSSSAPRRFVATRSALSPSSVLRWTEAEPVELCARPTRVE